MSKVTKKVSRGMTKLIDRELKKKFTAATELIKAAIIAEYDQELVDVVTDRNSKTNPNYYRDDFIERLNKFEYVEKSGDDWVITVPTMETFDFSGRLKVIEHIMEGMSGIYLEVNEIDFVDMFGNLPKNEDPLDTYVPPKERIYLVRHTSEVQQIAQDKNKKLVRYPFSNTPPIKILEEGEEFVDDNMSRWIEEALEEAQKEFVRTYRGAKL